jgi:hypothetical protein
MIAGAFELHVQHFPDGRFGGGQFKDLDRPPRVAR